MDPNVDLLGNNEMPVREPGRGFFAMLGYAFFYAVLTAVGAYVFLLARDKFHDMNEENQKKAVRRKYGIPDSSKEPFNVAYAKAEKTKKEQRQRQASPRIFDRREPVQQSSSFQRAPKLSTPQQRASAALNLGGRVASERSPLSRTWYPEREQNDDLSSDGLQLLQEASERDKRFPNTRNEFNDETNDSIEVDGTSFDGVSTAMGSFHGDFGTRKPPPLIHVRGAKRSAAPVDEIENIGSIGRKAGKRSRKQPRKAPSIYNENDGYGRLMDLDHVSRGKKRDRAEAGSTFGGDDESPLSGQGSRKTRKQKRKSDMSDILDGSFLSSRGTKRNFEVESTLDSEEDGSPRHTKMSRGLPRNESDSSDMSLDEPVVETACGNRRIGEEWHSNGTTFRVGQDGRRQRLVLLRRQRSRFAMPQDSQHPDSQAQLEVLVEAWLDDDEFAAAEERGTLYTPTSDTAATMDNSSPAKAGKQLLWGTSKKAALVPMPINSTIITPVPEGNPFERPSNGSGRRISLVSDSRTSPLASPSIRQSKSYSKWEKQDLEAEAMAKLRQKLEEEKKAEPAVVKKVTFDLPPSSSTSTAPSGATTPQTPAPSRDETPAATKQSMFSFGKPSESMPGPTSTAPPQIPTLSFTPPQTSKDQQAPQLARPSLFGGSSAQLPATSEKKDTTTPAPSVSPSSTSGASFPTVASSGMPQSSIGGPTFAFGKPELSTGNKSEPAPSNNSTSTMPNPFSAFGKTATSSETPKSLSDTSATSNAAQKPADQPSSTIAQPKFNFSGIAAKSPSIQAPAKPASPSSSPFAAPSQSTLAASSASPFAFANMKPSSSSEPPKSFQFGTSAGGTTLSTNTGMSNTNATAPTSSTPTSSLPPAGGFSFKIDSSAPNAAKPPSTGALAASGSTAPNSSPFGNSTSSPFGNTNKSSLSFGSSASPFGGASKPADSPFGSSSQAKETPKPLFNFGAASSEAKPAAEKTENKPTFMFNFGGSSGGAAGSTNTNTGTPNPFAAAAAPGGNTGSSQAFTFGSGTNNSPFGASSGNSPFAQK